MHRTGSSSTYGPRRHRLEADELTYREPIRFERWPRDVLTLRVLDMLHVQIEWIKAGVLF